MPSAEASRENGKKGGRPPGRPTSALTKIGEHKARKLASENETPLDVMIDNMLFWRKRAAALTEDMQAKIDIISKLDVSDEKQRADFMELMKEFNKVAAHMIAARAEAQSCAVDAAPYVHPRFASISVKQQNTNVKIQMSLTTAIANVLTDDNQPKQLNGSINGHAAESTAARD